MNPWSPANIKSMLLDLGSTGAGGVDPGLLLPSVAAFVAVTCALPLLVRLFKAGGLSWRSRFVRDVGHRLSESFVFLDPRQLFVTQCVLMVVVALWFAWWLDMIWVGLVVSILVGFLPGLLLRRLRQQRRDRFQSQFPDALMLIGASLRAGASVGSALAEAATQFGAPLGQELGLVLRELKLGLRMDAALARLERRLPLEDVRLFCSAIKIAQDTGGNLAETLQSVAESARTRAALEGKLDALTAQGRMQAWIMTALPLLVLIGIQIVDPGGAALLLGTLSGWLVLAAVVILQAAGMLMIRRILAIDL
jgi:tight adherence protein B